MSLTKVTYSMISGAPINLTDYGAVGDGVADDTAAIQLAVNAATAGQWIDGVNKTYKITGQITGTSASFRLRNVKFVFSTSYTTQGYFSLDAGSGTTAMTVALENIIVDGGRGTYKVGNEPWEVFATFAGYDSIAPALTVIFRVDSYNANTVVTMRSVNFHNVHSDACVQINTYGTVFIDDCEYKNISNKTFHVYHSPDDGVTQAGRTLVNNMITQARLNELFEYRNGVLYRKINQGSAKAGVKVGSINHQGYVRLSVDNKNVPIHRVIWIMHHGVTPLFIDHIDNNRENNNIENLRLVDRYGNAQNASMRKDNTSGAKGVNWHKGRNKWTAFIAYNRKQKHLGCFNTKEDAAEFVSLARDMLHKEYANHGILSWNTQVAVLTSN